MFIQRQSVMARCVKSRQTPVRSRKVSKRSPVGPRLHVVKSDVLVDEVADRLHSRPAGRRRVEQGAGEVFQFTIDFAVAAREQEQQDFVRQILHVVLRRIPGLRIRLSAILDDGIVTQHHAARGGEQATAPVPETNRRIQKSVRGVAPSIARLLESSRRAMDARRASSALPSAVKNQTQFRSRHELAKSLHCLWPVVVLRHGTRSATIRLPSMLCVAAFLFTGCPEIPPLRAEAGRALLDEHPTEGSSRRSAWRRDVLLAHSARRSRPA